MPSLQWTATDQIMSKKDTKIFDKKGPLNWPKSLFDYPGKMYNNQKHAYFDSCNVLQHLSCNIMNMTSHPGWLKKVVHTLQ